MRELKNCENRKKRNAREKKLADVSPTFKNCNSKQTDAHTIIYLFALLATEHGTQYADCQTKSNKAVQVDANKPPQQGYERVKIE